MNTPAEHLSVYLPRLIARYPNDDEVRIVAKAVEELTQGLRWTKALPTCDGMWLMRNLSSSVVFIELDSGGNPRWRSSGACALHDCKTFTDADWAGPIVVTEQHSL